MIVLLVSVLLGGHGVGNAHTHVAVVHSDDGLSVVVHDLMDGYFAPESYPLTISHRGMRLRKELFYADTVLDASDTHAWILPQNEDPNLPFLGFSTTRFPSGVQFGSTVQLALVGIDGPGDFSAVVVGPFGDASVLANTRDGIDESDSITLRAQGSHLHCNWIFSQPGLYKLTFVASWNSSEGAESKLTSSPATFQFRVLPPRLRVELKKDTDENLLMQFPTLPGVHYQVFRVRLTDSPLQAYPLKSAGSMIGSGDRISVRLETGTWNEAAFFVKQVFKTVQD
jgi:surface-anchored protein